MQRVKVNLSIEIPSEYVLISKVEFEELKQEQLSDVYWNMKDLSNRINKSDRWIKDNILYLPKFKKVLDSENGGFVYYPRNQGQTWSFQANRMTEFLDKNFTKIFQ